jgi:hypothetical protein
MKLLLFTISLFLRRLRDAVLRSLGLTIVLTALVLFLVITLSIYGIAIHADLDWFSFVLILAICQLGQICAFWFNTESLNRVLLACINSRYSRQTISRAYFLYCGMIALIPPLILLCLFLMGVYSLLPPAAPLPVLGLFTGFHFASSLLFQALSVRFSRAGALAAAVLTSAVFLAALYMGSLALPAAIAALIAAIAAFFLLTLRAEYAIQKPVFGAKLFLPRIKGLISDYINADFAVMYILALCASVYILYDFIKLIGNENPEPGVIKNYAMLSLLLGSLSFYGAIGSGMTINWNMQSFAGLSYRTYCVRSLAFLSLLSLPAWLPAFAVYCFWLPPSDVLLFPLVIGVNLLFTVHYCLLPMPRESRIRMLIRGAIWFAFIIAGAYCYHRAALPGLLLALPLMVVCIRARENIYDWGSYDYLR